MLGGVLYNQNGMLYIMISPLGILRYYLDGNSYLVDTEPWNNLFLSSIPSPKASLVLRIYNDRIIILLTILDCK